MNPEKDIEGANLMAVSRWTADSGRPWRGPVRFRGVSAVEMLVAVPALLLLAMAAVQFALVFQARHKLEYALNQAARQGAVDHASEMAIVSGLAAGLTPWLYNSRNIAEKIANEKLAMAHVVRGRAEGWIDLAQRSPTRESFRDWAEPALDAYGRVIPGQTEIPNDNLDNRRQKAQPASGVQSHVGGDPVGRASGQTLTDANILRLEMQYGVPLNVPLIGKSVLAMLRRFNGCDNFVGRVASLSDEVDRCRFYAAGRIPVSTVATVRMMSPARQSSLLGNALASSGGRGGTAAANRPVAAPAQAERAGAAEGNGPTEAADTPPHPDTLADDDEEIDLEDEERSLDDEQPEGQVAEAGADQEANARQEEIPAMSEVPWSGNGSLLDHIIEPQPHPELCQTVDQAAEASGQGA